MICYSRVIYHQVVLIEGSSEAITGKKSATCRPNVRRLSPLGASIFNVFPQVDEFFFFFFFFSAGFLQGSTIAFVLCVCVPVSFGSAKCCFAQWSLRSPSICMEQSRSLRSFRSW